MWPSARRERERACRPGLQQYAGRLNLRPAQGGTGTAPDRIARLDRHFPE